MVDRTLLASGCSHLTSMCAVLSREVGRDMIGLEVYLIAAPLVLAGLAIFATWWFVGREKGILRPHPSDGNPTAPVYNTGIKFPFFSNRPVYQNKDVIRKNGVADKDYTLNGISYPDVIPTHQSPQSRQ